MNTSGTSRNTTMTCIIEQKKPPLLSKGQPVWVKTPTTKEAAVVKNATPRPVVVQIAQGSQRRKSTQLRRRRWNQKGTQPATPRATAILPKQNLETPVKEAMKSLLKTRLPHNSINQRIGLITRPWNKMVKRQCTLQSQDEKSTRLTD